MKGDEWLLREVHGALELDLLLERVDLRSHPRALAFVDRQLEAVGEACRVLELEGRGLGVRQAEPTPPVHGVDGIARHTDPELPALIHERGTHFVIVQVPQLNPVAHRHALDPRKLEHPRAGVVLRIEGQSQDSAGARLALEAGRAEAVADRHFARLYGPLVGVVAQAAPHELAHHGQHYGVGHTGLARPERHVHQTAATGVGRRRVEARLRAGHHAREDPAEADAPHADDVLGAAQVDGAVAVHVAQQAVRIPHLAIHGAQQAHELDVLEHGLPNHVPGVEEVGGPHIGPGVRLAVVVQVAVSAAGEHERQVRRAQRTEDARRELEEQRVPLGRAALAADGARDDVETVAVGVQGAHRVAHRGRSAHVTRDRLDA